MKKRPRPPKRPSWKKYMIAYALLYGEFVWLERHVDGSITIPIRKMCIQLRIKTDHLKEALQELYDIGGLSVFKWHGHWALVKASVPIRMERRIEEYVEQDDVRMVEEISRHIETQYEHEDGEGKAE